MSTTKLTRVFRGISALCQIDGCKDIAEWLMHAPAVLGQNVLRDVGLEQEIQICAGHLHGKIKDGDGIDAKRIPYIMREADGTLNLQCQRCGDTWIPQTFMLPKDNPQFGVMPSACRNRKCRGRFVTKVRRKAGPTFRKNRNKVTGGRKKK